MTPDDRLETQETAQALEAYTLLLQTRDTDTAHYLQFPTWISYDYQNHNVKILYLSLASFEDVGWNTELDPCIERVRKEQKEVTKGARFGAHSTQTQQRGDLLHIKCSSDYAPTLYTVLSTSQNPIQLSALNRCFDHQAHD